MPTAWKKLARFFARLFAESLCWLGLLSIVRYYVTGLTDFKPDAFWNACYVGGLYGVMLWEVRRTQKTLPSPSGSLSLNPQAIEHRLMQWLTGGVVGIFLVLLCWTVGLTLGMLRWQVPVIQEPVGTLFLSVLFTALAIAFIEERLFRGLVVDIFALSYSPTQSAILQGGVFSLLHQLNGLWGPEMRLGSGLGLWMVGWILAQLRFATRGLATGMGLHAGWIFICLITARLNGLEYIAQEQLYWAFQEINPVSGWVGISVLVGTSYVIMKANRTTTVQHER